MSTSRLEVRGLSVRRGSTNALTGIDLSFAPGEFVAVAGPNGAGKSTLLSVMAGLVRPTSGECRYRNRLLPQWPRRELARRIAFVPQTQAFDFAFTVEEVVLMGRAPHGAGLFETDADRAAMERALAHTDVLALRHRDIRTLSGGERQRVVIAAALAQEPETLLLDEPAAALDLEHQVLLYRLLADLRDAGTLVIAATHDLNLAAASCDRLVLLHEGRVAADGPPAACLTAERLADVFHVAVDVRHDAGRLWIRYGP